MLLVVIADKVLLKRSYRAEFKLTLPELFVEGSKKTPSLNSASLSTRRFAACAYFFEVAWRSNLENHSRAAPVHPKPTGVTAVRWSQGSMPRKYATHDTYTLIFPVHKLRQTELTKDIRSKWRLWPLRPAVCCTRGGADWPKVVAVGAQQPIGDFFGFIQMRDTLSTNGEHHRVAEVKSFPAIPKSIRSVNGDQNGANLKKWSVLLVRTIGGGTKASGCRRLEWWSSGKKALRTDSLLFGSTRCSLRTLSFYLIRHKNDYIVRFRCKYPFFLFFTTCHILLFQVDLASRHWTCWKVTPWHAEHLYERVTDWRSAECLAGISSLRRSSFLFLIFFLIEFHGKFWVLVSRPRKKVPHSRMFIGDWLHDDRTKQRFRSVASPMKCEALVLFWRECLLHLYTTRTTSPSWNQKKTRPNSVHNRTQPSFFLPSNTFLYRTHLSVFGVPPSRSAHPQIHGNRGQWRNSHKPHPNCLNFLKDAYKVYQGVPPTYLSKMHQSQTLI